MDAHYVKLVIITWNDYPEDPQVHGIFEYVHPEDP